MYIIFLTLRSIKQSNARSQTWVSDSDDRVQLMNKSFHTYEWVILHVWICHITHVGHVTHMNDSCHTLTVRIATESCHVHVWMNNDTYKHEWVKLYTHINESCCTCEWGVMSGRWVISHIAYHCDSFMNEFSRTYLYAFDAGTMPFNWLMLLLLIRKK